MPYLHLDTVLFGSHCGGVPGIPYLNLDTVLFGSHCAVRTSSARGVHGTLPGNCGLGVPESCLCRGRSVPACAPRRQRSLRCLSRKPRRTPRSQSRAKSARVSRTAQVQTRKGVGTVNFISPSSDPQRRGSSRYFLDFAKRDPAQGPSRVPALCTSPPRRPSRPRAATRASSGASSGGHSG